MTHRCLRFKPFAIVSLVVVIAGAAYAIGVVDGLQERDRQRLDRAIEDHARSVDRARQNYIAQIERANAGLENQFQRIIAAYQRRGHDNVVADLMLELQRLMESALKPPDGRGDGADSGQHAELINAIGHHLVNARGEAVPTGMIANNRYIVLYFSASWCRPCRTYTPRLVDFYREYGGAGVEVILVSSDRNETQFAEYVSSMPWLAIPYERIRESGIREALGGRTIPRVVVLNPQGEEVMNSDLVDRNEIPGRLAAMLQ